MSADIETRIVDIGLIDGVKRARRTAGVEMGILHVRGALEALNKTPDEGAIWRAKVALLQAINELVRERRRMTK